MRALLTGRKLLPAKLLDVEEAIRGMLRDFGLKVGATTRPRCAVRVRESVGGHAMLERVVEPTLRARHMLQVEFAGMHRQLLTLMRGDTVCRRLMTTAGVEAVVAATFTLAVYDPARFTKSRTVGAHFGLTPQHYQSGETGVTGGISKVGGTRARTVLYEAAQTMLTRTTRFSTLKDKVEAAYQRDQT